MLRNADLAPYRAKAGGNARWALFESSMERDAIERLELETDLRQALERNEFCLVYQPIVSLRDGEVVEVEALARWHHPVRGQISPGQFIPIAEETGLIKPLGLWVLEEACRQAVVWEQVMAPERQLVMSVNLSSRQFQDYRVGLDERPGRVVLADLVEFPQVPTIAPSFFYRRCLPRAIVTRGMWATP